VAYINHKPPVDTEDKELARFLDAELTKIAAFVNKPRLEWLALELQNSEIPRPRGGELAYYEAGLAFLPAPQKRGLYYFDDVTVAWINVA